MKNSLFKTLFVSFCLFLGAFGNHLFSGEGSLKQRIFSKPWSGKEIEATTSVVVDETGHGEGVQAPKLSAERQEELGQVEKACLSDDFSKPVTSENPLVGFWKVSSYECPQGGVPALADMNNEMKKSAASSYWKITDDHIITKNTYRNIGVCVNCGHAEFKKTSDSTFVMNYLNRATRCAGQDIQEDAVDILKKPMNLVYKMSGKKLLIEFPKEGHSGYFTQWCEKGSFIVHLERQ